MALQSPSPPARNAHAHFSLVQCKERRGARSQRDHVSNQERLVFKAHRLLYHSTLGLRVIKKKDTGARVAKVAISEKIY